MSATAVCRDVGGILTDALSSRVTWARFVHIAVPLGVPLGVPVGALGGRLIGAVGRPMGVLGGRLIGALGRPMGVLGFPLTIPIFREVDMRIEDILRDKGRDVVTITEDMSVLDAARALVEHNIGGLVVMEGDRLAGILTERDILRLVARAAGEMGSTLVGAAMTKKVIVAHSGDDHTELMNVMTENRIRHLPVVEEDRLIGIISIGDLVNACRHAAEAENSQLRQYIQGTG